jgi:hypothetical protein
MTIAELAARGKPLLDRIPAAYLTAAAIILAGTAGFAFGVLEGREEARAGGISVTTLGTTTPGFMGKQAAAAAAAGASVPASAPAALPSGGEYVASKSGAKYYLPWCGGAKLIKDENKVWFASKADAEAAGYAPAANCKGL